MPDIQPMEPGRTASTVNPAPVMPSVMPRSSQLPRPASGTDHFANNYFPCSATGLVSSGDTGGTSVRQVNIGVMASRRMSARRLGEARQPGKGWQAAVPAVR